jgi:hypothetical protein
MSDTRFDTEEKREHMKIVEQEVTEAITSLDNALLAMMETTKMTLELTLKIANEEKNTAVELLSETENEPIAKKRKIEECTLMPPPKKSNLSLDKSQSSTDEIMSTTEQV